MHLTTQFGLTKTPKYYNTKLKMAFSICIQAGGESRRMGENKALMLFAGQTLIKRVIERVKPLTDEIIIISNDVESFQFLKLPVVPDHISGQGALSGLYTALSAAKHPYVAVVACDMPFVNPELLKAECILLINEQADVVIPQSPNGLEPLHAIYRRKTCLPFVHDALFQGKRRLIGWLEHVTVRVMSRVEVERYSPEFNAFVNLNTPEEFNEAEKLNRRLSSINHQ